MNVVFKNARLRKAYESKREATKNFGELGRTYISRINTIYACETVEDFRSFPQLKFHALKGQRKGQFAISLSGNLRLIITIKRVKKQTLIRIEEVSKHYD